MHELDTAIIWHGRLMVLAWAILLPAGVITARFFKILPSQNWPQNLDNRIWWYAHLTLQYTGAAVTLVALVLVFKLSGFNLDHHTVHKLLGWGTIILLVVQVGFGLLRGSKGGPSDVKRTGTERGDHYDMTLRRRVFETVHKTTGYAVLVIASLAIVFGLEAADAPLWMFVTIVVWWCLLGWCFFYLQSLNLTMGSYEAIWGNKKSGNSGDKSKYSNHPWIKS